MKYRSIILTTWLLLIHVAAPRVVAQEATGTQGYVAGNALLEQGDLSGALQAYARAARADRSNQQYAQQFMLVRRALFLQQNLDKQKDPERWEQMALALSSFYVSRQLYSHALPVDRQLHARLNTAWSAAQLAETQLALNNASAAVAVLSSLAPKKITLATQSLLGIALARQGKMDMARQIADTVVPPDGADCDTLYRAARVHAAVGDHDYALALLARCFAAVPPSRLSTLKLQAKRSPDFARLVSSADFAAVMQTESKVQESPCSAGTSCSNCPLRGRCQKDNGQ